MENRSLGLNRVRKCDVHVIPTLHPHHAIRYCGRLSIKTSRQNSEESNKSRAPSTDKPAKGRPIDRSGTSSRIALRFEFVGSEVNILEGSRQEVGKGPTRR